MRACVRAGWMVLFGAVCAVRGASSARADDASAPSCPRGQPLRVEGKIASGKLEEISGLVASRAQPGVLWVHNDSGDGARIYALDPQGKLLLELGLKGVKVKDAEDIALGPRRGARGDHLYLADTGDNDRTREAVQIVRVPEPKVTRGAKKGKLKGLAHVIQVRYEDGRHDVEALLVDPRSGDVYLVEKGPLFAPRKDAGIYRIAARELEQPRALARRVGSVPFGPVTAGDVLADGSGIALRSYTRLLFWPRGEGESVADALARSGCELPLADLGQQGEALGFLGGGGYLTIAEGEHARIYRYALTR